MTRTSKPLRSRIHHVQTGRRKRKKTHRRLFLVLLQNGSSEKREVRQFQFTAWPDHGVPEYPTPFLAFLRRVKTCNPPDAGPIIAHCRSAAALKELNSCTSFQFAGAALNRSDVAKCFSLLAGHHVYILAVQSVSTSLPPSRLFPPRLSCRSVIILALFAPLAFCKQHFSGAHSN